MWLLYKLSHLTSSRGAGNDASKIEHNKKQQPENTANNNQIFWATAITHMQDARHPIHRVRISYSKFSSPKTCRNVHESSLKVNAILLPLEPQRAIDARAWSSRNCKTSQICKPRKHALTFLMFPSVKFCENLNALLYRCLPHNIIFWKKFV